MVLKQIFLSGKTVLWVREKILNLKIDEFMSLKCLFNKGKDLPSDLFFSGSSCKVSSNFFLEIGNEYIVYAMIVNDGYIWYYICDENFTYYPKWHPCPLFEIVDDRLSKYWVFSYRREIDNNSSEFIWAYPEWANDPMYYENLFDGREREVKIFRQYKLKMDLEFRDPLITDSAEEIDAEWLLCPFCIDAWQEVTKFEMVICPKCQRKMINPHRK